MRESDNLISAVLQRALTIAAFVILVIGLATGAAIVSLIVFLIPYLRQSP